MVALVLFMGCASVKKQENKARGFYLDHKDKLAELSRMVFPIKEGYKEGERIEMKHDTVFTKGDTVVITVDCPDGSKVSRVVRKTDTLRIYVPILRVDTVTRADSSGNYMWKHELQSETEKRIRLDTEVNLLRKQRAALVWWLIGLGVGLVGLVCFMIFGKRVF